MIFTNIYTLKILHSVNIENKQSNKTINYSLCSSKNDTGRQSYGIRIESCVDSIKSESIIENISDNKDLVNEIIKYLYQNCIDDTCLRDIIHDLLFEFEERGVKYR